MSVYVPTLDELLGATRREPELLDWLRRLPREKAKRWLGRLERKLLEDTIAMAISGANLVQNGLSATQSSFTTASITRGANKLDLLCVTTLQGSSTNPTTPTVTGAGATWTQVLDFLWKNAGATRVRTTIFRALDGGGSGALTIDYGGVNQTGCAWICDELSGIDISGTNGSGAIVQTGTTTAGATGTSGSITLAAFGSANNANYGHWSAVSNTAITPGTGFTELADVAPASLGVDEETEYKINDNVTAASWVTSAAYGGEGIEIKAAAAVVSALLRTLLGVGL